MPTEPTSTIIRNNVFIKNDWRSPDGDRPNLLVGGFPRSGTGSQNRYEIYGNFFLHNHREALFQGSGRISLHDNIFVDGPARLSRRDPQTPKFPSESRVRLQQHRVHHRAGYSFRDTSTGCGRRSRQSGFWLSTDHRGDSAFLR